MIVAPWRSLNVQALLRPHQPAQKELSTRISDLVDIMARILATDSLELKARPANLAQAVPMCCWQAEKPVADWRWAFHWSSDEFCLRVEGTGRNLASFAAPFKDAGRSVIAVDLDLVVGSTGREGQLVEDVE